MLICMWQNMRAFGKRFCAFWSKQTKYIPTPNSIPTMVLVSCSGVAFQQEERKSSLPSRVTWMETNTKTTTEWLEESEESVLERPSWIQMKIGDCKTRPVHQCSPSNLGKKEKLFIEEWKKLPSKMKMSKAHRDISEMTQSYNPCKWTIHYVSTVEGENSSINQCFVLSRFKK